MGLGQQRPAVVGGDIGSARGVQDAGDLSGDRFGLGHVLDEVVAADGGEAARLERQRLGVGAQQQGLGAGFAQALAADQQPAKGRVDADDGTVDCGGGGFQGGRAAAQVEQRGAGQARGVDGVQDGAADGDLTELAADVVFR